MHDHREDIKHRRGDINQGGKLTLTPSNFWTIPAWAMSLVTLLGIALKYLCDKYEYIALRNDRVPNFWSCEHLNFERLKLLS